MSGTLDLGIEAVEGFDAPTLSDFEQGVVIGLAIVAIAVMAT
jgi:hypothetical protein